MSNAKRETPTVTVPEPYTTEEQRAETSHTGMWLFLATEVMFFAGLFAAYTVYRYLYSETFRELSRHLDVAMGTLNTAVLLTSSFAMALAVHAAKRAAPGDEKKASGWLLVTLVLGVAFLGIKAKEWVDDYHHGLFPGHWHYSGPHADTAELFFYVYYAMVGLHGLHVIIGALLVGFFAWYVQRRKDVGRDAMKIEVLGLYWHYVDLVWIFLYPLFYLVDPK